MKTYFGGGKTYELTDTSPVKLKQESPRVHIIGAFLAVPGILSVWLPDKPKPGGAIFYIGNIATYDLRICDASGVVLKTIISGKAVVVLFSDEYILIEKSIV